MLYDFALKFPEIPARFELVSSYPRRTLGMEKDGGPTLEALGLGHSCVLFVRDITEDEEEEEGEEEEVEEEEEEEEEEEGEEGGED